LLAPLQKNQPVATLKVLLNQAPLVEIPLLALSAVEEAGFFGRTWDTLTLWLK
jgi:D-alanyl-D-alanine carboxypeptidase (penicillin-binding protein 5/6)